MTPSLPEFWGSWKGRVLKAIAVDGVRRWEEIRELTGLSEESIDLSSKCVGVETIPYAPAICL